MQGLKGFGEGLMEAASASSAMSTQEAQAFGSPAAAENNMKAVLGQALGEAKQSLLGEAQSKAKEVLAGQDVPAKQLNFERLLNTNKDAPGTPSTPVIKPSTKPEPPTPAGSEDSAINYNAFMLDTIMWTNKLRSVLYLIGGLLATGLLYKLLASSNTLVTGVCYAALAQMAINFLRTQISPKLQERCTWYDSAWRQAAVDYFSSWLKAAAAVNDRHMDGSNPTKTLKIGAALWAISIAGRCVSAFQLLWLLWLAAFSLPKAYSMFQDRVNRVVGTAVKTATDKFYGVDRRVRAVAVVAPILAAGYVLSRVDLTVAVFLLLVYVRSWMQPDQVAAFHKHAVAPLTATASKFGASLGSSAMEMAVRYDLTPTPAKAKRA